jgi:hypothetical protein
MFFSCKCRSCKYFVPIFLNSATIYFRQEIVHHSSSVHLHIRLFRLLTARHKALASLLPNIPDTLSLTACPALFLLELPSYRPCLALISPFLSSLTFLTSQITLSARWSLGVCWLGDPAWLLWFEPPAYVFVHILPYSDELHCQTKLKVATPNALAIRVTCNLICNPSFPCVSCRESSRALTHTFRGFGAVQVL